MKKNIISLTILFLFGCYSNSNNKTTNVVSDTKNLKKGLSCDSLIERLVRKGKKSIQCWYEVKVQERKEDSVLIRVYATNGKGDTITINRIVLVISKNELKDITLDPIVIRDLEIDTKTMNLIKANCSFSK